MEEHPLCVILQEKPTVILQRDAVPGDVGHLMARQDGPYGPRPFATKPWPFPYRLPHFPHEIESAMRSDIVMNRSKRRRVVQVLYDDMIQYSRYPRSREYDEVCRALVCEYPLLSDVSDTRLWKGSKSNASPYRSWLESLKTKFKSERGKIFNDEEVDKIRCKYSTTRRSLLCDGGRSRAIRRTRRMYQEEMADEMNITEQQGIMAEELEMKEHPLCVILQENAIAILPTSRDAMPGDVGHFMARQDGPYGPRPAATKPWPFPYRLPHFPHEIESAMRSDIVMNRSRRRRVVQVLYDDMIQYSLYPRSREYNEVCRTLVYEYPLLSDTQLKEGPKSNGSPYRSWLESLKTKFKSERSKILNDEEVERIRNKYSTTRRNQTFHEDSSAAQSEQELFQDGLEDETNVGDQLEIKAEELDGGDGSPDGMEEEISSILQRDSGDVDHFMARHDESYEPQPATTKPWPFPYRLPKFPHEIESAMTSDVVMNRSKRRRVVQVLYDDMNQYSRYPRSREYNEVCRTLVYEYPLLSDTRLRKLPASNVSPYRTWLESLRTKFKSERRKILNDEEIEKIRSKYSTTRRNRPYAEDDFDAGQDE